MIPVQQQGQNSVTWGDNSLKDVALSSLAAAAPVAAFSALIGLSAALDRPTASLGKTILCATIIGGLSAGGASAMGRIAHKIVTITRSKPIIRDVLGTLGAVAGSLGFLNCLSFIDPQIAPLGRQFQVAIPAAIAGFYLTRSNEEFAGALVSATGPLPGFALALASCSFLSGVDNWAAGCAGFLSMLSAGGYIPVSMHIAEQNND